ncbi:MAG: hypothetical protein ACTHU7_07300, partial [Microbacterium sp.]
LIVASVRNPDGSASLIRMNDDGSAAEEFALPGDGTIRNLQLSERGGRIGYTYTDLPASPGEAPEREAQLFTASLRAPGDAPSAVAVADEVPSVDTWQFVPDSSAVLLIDFTGELVIVEPGSDSEPGVLGSAVDIDAVARGTYTAIVERLEDGMVWIDLATGDEEPLVAPDPEPGLLGNVLPLPSATGETGGVDSVRQYTVLGDDGVPTSPVHGARRRRRADGAAGDLRRGGRRGARGAHRRHAGGAAADLPVAERALCRRDCGGGSGIQPVRHHVAADACSGRHARVRHRIGRARRDPARLRRLMVRRRAVTSDCFCGRVS